MRKENQKQRVGLPAPVLRDVWASEPGGWQKAIPELAKRHGVGQDKVLDQLALCAARNARRLRSSWSRAHAFDLLIIALLACASITGWEAYKRPHQQHITTPQPISARRTIRPYAPITADDIQLPSDYSPAQRREVEASLVGRYSYDLISTGTPVGASHLSAPRAPISWGENVLVRIPLKFAPIRNGPYPITIQLFAPRRDSKTAIAFEVELLGYEPATQTAIVLIPRQSGGAIMSHLAQGNLFVVETP